MWINMNYLLLKALYTKYNRAGFEQVGGKCFDWLINRFVVRVFIVDFVRILLIMWLKK